MSAVEGDADLAWVGAGRDDEVVFKLALGAVVDEVDAGVDTRIADLAEGGDVLVPVLRIVANVVVHLAEQRRLADHGGRGARADEPHRQKGSLGGGARPGSSIEVASPIDALRGPARSSLRVRRLAERKQRLRGLQKKRITAATSEEAHPRVGLTAIRLEAHLELAVAGIDARDRSLVRRRVASDGSAARRCALL